MSNGDEGRQEFEDDFMLRSLTEAPGDWLCWVLERVSQDDRNRIIKEGLEAFSFFDLIEPDLTEQSFQVLRVLASTKKRTLDQLQMENELEDAKTPITRRTFGAIVNRLIELRYVCRPHGDRKGVCVTTAGRKLLTSDSGN